MPPIVSPPTLSPPIVSPPTLSPPRIGTRAHNLALALRHVAESPGDISRAGISARTGLNRSTTSSLIDELIAGGLVREAGETTRSGVGRRGTALELSPDGPAGLGLDLDTGHAVACVADLTGRIRFCRSATDRRAIGGPARDAVAEAGLTLCGTVVVDGEANYAALAEDELLRAGESFLYVSARTRIAAALVVDGRLYRGRHGHSGEIGHVRIDPNGPECPCGHRGCLEMYAGPGALQPGAGTILGGVVASYLTLLDLDRIVLGGIYRDHYDWIAPEVERAIATQYTGARPAVVRATYGIEAPAVGAARSAVREVLDDPYRWLTLGRPEDLAQRR
ncbi:transcriptional regulator [Paractinoplanes durhamensis]|uniref:Transcriptional regulator n=1 Tax=Paractinoplanes durhamensis TaxID=113563 RepID=A0ABQ3Z8N0_9ACTN|nr:transcriptional regulator [Actinoplanes durhamensis]